MTDATQLREEVVDYLEEIARQYFWKGFTCGAVLIAAVAVLAALVLI